MPIPHQVGLVRVMLENEAGKRDVVLLGLGERVVLAR